MQLAFLVLATSVLIGALSTPLFRDAEGFLTPGICLVFSCVVALLGLTAAWKSPLRRSAAWFALLIVGQGLSLQLIDAGTAIRYQHYRPANGLQTDSDLWLLGALTVQAIVVVVALHKRFGVISAWVREHLGMTRTLVVAGVFIGAAAFPSRDLTAFGIELALSGLLSIVQLGCLLLGMMAIPRQTISKLDTRFRQFLEGPPRAKNKPFSSVDRLVLVGAAWILITATWLVIFSYERHPHVPDEVAYLFHANYFSKGQISVPAPPVLEAVDVYLIDCNEERCISPVPPGWPAMLAVGAFFDLPWLVNPLLAGINLFLIFFLLRELYDRRTARLGILLVAVSPWYLFMAMSFMTHIFSLFCALVAAVSVVRMRRTGACRWGIPGGLAIGWLSLTRPLEGLMAASVLGLAALGIRGRRFRLGPVTILGFSSLIVGALVLPYNYAMTGETLGFPIMAYADKVLGPGVNSLGFGSEKGVEWGGLDPFPGHGLRDVILNADLNFVAINIELFGWPIGSLLPILLFLVSRSMNRVDLWMLLCIAVVVGLQSLYWFSGGPDFAARYWFLIVIPCVALTARAILYLGHLADSSGFTYPQASVAVMVGVLVLSLSALVNFVPWRAIDKYHHYRGMRPDMRTLIAENDMSRALVLVSGKSQPDLSSAWVYSALDPNAHEPVIVWDRNEKIRRRLLAAYPDRPIWLVEGPSLTAAGYRVVAGPLNASEFSP